MKDDAFVGRGPAEAWGFFDLFRLLRTPDARGVEFAAPVWPEILKFADAVGGKNGAAILRTMAELAENGGTPAHAAHAYALIFTRMIRLHPPITAPQLIEIVRENTGQVISLKTAKRALSDVRGMGKPGRPRRPTKPKSAKKRGHRKP